MEEQSEPIEEVVDNNELEESIEEYTSSAGALLAGIIASYQEAYNHNNDKNEIKYILTDTTHKLDIPNKGKRDVAYLRLQRAIRSKIKEIVDPNSEQPFKEPEWNEQLIYQEMHVFSSMAERVNPKAPWREAMYLRFIYRLVAGGLEYAELLNRMKNTQKEEKPTSNLIITDQMPTPLTPAEEEYKKEVESWKK